MLSVTKNSAREHATAPPANERELLQYAANGDRTAFTALYTYYFPRLYRFVFFINQSPENTEEVLQEVFLKIWDRRLQLNKIRSLEDYLFRMAKNQLFDLMKKDQAKLKMIRRLVPQETDSGTDDELTFREYRKVAMEAITRLPERKRRVFLMRVEDEMSLDEIAAALKISRSAVKKHLYSAMEHVKEYLRLHAEWTIGLVFLLFFLF